MQHMIKDRLIRRGQGRIISLVNRARSAALPQAREACGKRIMKGMAMNLKFAEHSKVARWGVALGVLLYAVWRGLVWFFIPGQIDPRRLRGWRGSQCS